MSGQPYVYPSDPDKFRQEYIDSLNLRANLDKINYDANRLYKKTGQISAISELSDTRSTVEKLADVQKTRIELIKDLAPIADNQFAQAIIQGIERSPLNTDGSLYNFFIQRAPSIVQELQRSYKYKIKGDANDAETFIKFIENFYTQSRDLTGSVKSYFNRPLSDNRVGILTEGDLDTIKAQLNEALNKFITKFNIRGNSAMVTFNEQAKQVLEKINRLTQFLSSKEYKFLSTNFSDDIINNRLNLNAPELVQYKNAYKHYIELIESLPKPASVIALINQLEKSQKNDTPRLSTQIMININELFPDPERLETAIRSLADIVTSRGPEEGRERTVEEATQNKLKKVNPTEFIQIAQTIVNKNRFHTATDDRNQELLDIDLEFLERVVNREEQYDEYKLKNIISEVLELTGQQVGIAGLGVKRRIKGSGISKHTDLTKGVQPAPRYVSYGNKIINTKKLEDNIIALKRKSGTNIKEFPSYRVSENLAKVIKDIVGGRISNMTDISKLTKQEQEYLYKLNKASDIYDKLNIQTPNKDEQEKEFNKFEVMKGEILSGNDSKELIRNFKTLCLKLGREGKLPRNQVSDILTELVQLGY